MDRDWSADAMRRMAFDYYFGGQPPNPSNQEPRDQTIPVNVYETDEDVVVVAPMPGVEAENIDIEILENTVTLRASLRGPGQQDRQYVVHEWTYGPYFRSVSLPVDVDGEHANASHGNGVLVLSIPKSRSSKPFKVPLRQSGSDEARQEGHRGHHTTREGLSRD